MKNRTRLLLYLFLPLIFFIGWLGNTTWSYVRTSGAGFRTLESEYGIQSLEGNTEGYLLKGQTIKAKFTVDQPNLGTVTVRFNNFNRDNDDWLTFRIKESNQSDWYYQANYKTDQFRPGILFPFGFPPISESTGREYLFEIESLGGSVLNSVALDKTNPVFVARYAVGKQLLLKNPSNLVRFLLAKGSIMTHDKKFLSSWKIFGVFISLYFAALLLHKKFTSWYLLTNLATFGVIIYNPDYTWYLIIVLWILWLSIIFFFKKTAKSLAITAILYLIIVMILPLLQRPDYIERVANWVYYFSLLAFIQSVVIDKLNAATIKTLKKIIFGKYTSFLSLAAIAGYVIFSLKDVLNYYVLNFKHALAVPPILLFGIALLFLVAAVISKKKVVLVTLLAIFLFKLPFIFHGNWENKMFVPYMTDEVIYASSLITSFTKHQLSLNKFLITGYPPFLFNLLFGYFYLFFNLLKLFSVNLTDIGVTKIIYYHGRFIILFASMVGTYFYIKLFAKVIKSSFYQILLSLLITLNGLFFLYSTYIKADTLVWATGSIALYFGLLFWQHQSRSNYIKFAILSLLPALVHYHGYIYLAQLALISVLSSLNKYRQSDSDIGPSTKALIFFLLLPSIWLLANFQLLSHFQEVVTYLTNFITGQNTGEFFVAFLENINNYPSYRYYLDYTKNFLSPLPLIVLGLFLFIKRSNTYFRAITTTTAIFTLQISLASYRTDRIFLFVYIFLTTIVVYLFSIVYEHFSKSKLKFVIVSFSLALMLPVFAKSFVLIKSLPGEDTRLLLYRFIQRELPFSSKITILHNSIFGAHATGQYLRSNNQNQHDVQILDLSVKEEKVKVKDINGYFVVSAFDLDILKKYSNTPYYDESYKVVDDLMKRSYQITSIDKIDFKTEPLGPADVLPNSLYGIQNPPLYLYKTNQ